MKLNRKPDRFSRSVFARDILHHLRMGIISGELSAHYRLVEAQLAEEYGVSRGPVRSALQALEQQGLVRNLPSGGAEVVGFTQKRALDLFDVREHLEEMAAKAIVSSEHLDFSTVRTIVQSMANPGHSIQRLGELDMDFHFEFMRLADNWALLQLWLTISPIVGDMLTYTNSLYIDPQLIASNHAALLEAAEKKDLQLLLRLIHEQMNLPRRLVSERFQAAEEANPS